MYVVYSGFPGNSRVHTIVKVQIGTVKELWRYPVKSMVGELLQETQIEKFGMVGDRSWAVRDEVANQISGVRKLPRLLRCTAQFEEQPRAGRTGADVPSIGHINGLSRVDILADCADRTCRPVQVSIY
jgi:hypothetical protein